MSTLDNASFARSWERTFQDLHRKDGGHRLTAPVVLTGFYAVMWRAFVLVSVVSFLLRVLAVGIEALT